MVHSYFYVIQKIDEPMINVSEKLYTFVCQKKIAAHLSSARCILALCFISLYNLV